MTTVIKKPQNPTTYKKQPILITRGKVSFFEIISNKVVYPTQDNNHQQIHYIERSNHECDDFIENWKIHGG
jgi:hypothetical protein